MYDHVELDRHDVLFAAGLAAESYLDTGNSSQSANAPLASLHPELSARDARRPAMRARRSCWKVRTSRHSVCCGRR